MTKLSDLISKPYKIHTLDPDTTGLGITYVSKDVYSTLVDLQTAYPTPVDNTFYRIAFGGPDQVENYCYRASKGWTVLSSPPSNGYTTSFNNGNLIKNDLSLPPYILGFNGESEVYPVSLDSNYDRFLFVNITSVLVSPFLKDGDTILKVTGNREKNINVITLTDSMTGTNQGVERLFLGWSDLAQIFIDPLNIIRDAHYINQRDYVDVRYSKDATGTTVSFSDGYLRGAFTNTNNGADGKFGNTAMADHTGMAQRYTLNKGQVPWYECGFGVDPNAITTLATKADLFVLLPSNNQYNLFYVTETFTVWYTADLGRNSDSGVLSWQDSGLSLFNFIAPRCDVSGYDVMTIIRGDIDPLLDPRLANNEGKFLPILHIVSDDNHLYESVSLNAERDCVQTPSSPLGTRNNEYKDLKFIVGCGNFTSNSSSSHYFNFTANTYLFCSREGITLRKNYNSLGTRDNWVATGGQGLLTISSDYAADGWGNWAQFSNNGFLERFTLAENQYANKTVDLQQYGLGITPYATFATWLDFDNNASVVNEWYEITANENAGGELGWMWYGDYWGPATEYLTPITQTIWVPRSLNIKKLTDPRYEVGSLNEASLECTSWFNIPEGLLPPGDGNKNTICSVKFPSTGNISTYLPGDIITLTSELDLFFIELTENGSGRIRQLETLPINLGSGIRVNSRSPYSWRKFGTAADAFYLFSPDIFNKGRENQSGYGNDIEFNSYGVLQRYTLNETQYNKLTKTVYLDAKFYGFGNTDLAQGGWVSRPADPGVGELYGNVDDGLVYKWFDSLGTWTAEWLPGGRNITINDWINPVFTVAEDVSEIVITNSDPSYFNCVVALIYFPQVFTKRSQSVKIRADVNIGNQLPDPIFIVADFETTTLHTGEMSMNNTTCSGIFTDKHDCNIIEIMDAGTWKITSGTQAMLSQPSYHGDGWGNSAKQNKAGFNTRYTLSEQEYSAVEQIYELDPATTGPGLSGPSAAYASEADLWASNPVKGFYDVGADDLNNYLWWNGSQNNAGSNYRLPKGRISLQPYIACTNGENRLILLGNDTDSTFAFIKLPGINETTISDQLQVDHRYEVDGALSYGAFIFSDQWESTSTRELYYDPSLTAYREGILVSIRRHMQFEYYGHPRSNLVPRLTHPWAAVGLHGLLMSTSNADGWGNSAELDSNGFQTRWTLSEDQYNTLTSGGGSIITPLLLNTTTPTANNETLQVNGHVAIYNGNLKVNNSLIGGEMVDTEGVFDVMGNPTNSVLLSVRSNFTSLGEHGMIRFGDASQFNAYQKGAIIYEGVTMSSRGRFHIALQPDDGPGNVQLSDAILTVTSDKTVLIGQTENVGNPTKLVIRGNPLAENYVNFSQVKSERVYDGVSNDILDTIIIRDSAGVGWDTVQCRIQALVDSTYMGWIGFNGTGNQGGISFGVGVTGYPNQPQAVAEVMRIDQFNRLLLGTKTDLIGVGQLLQVNGSSLVMGDATFKSKSVAMMTTVTRHSNVSCIRTISNGSGSIPKFTIPLSPYAQMSSTVVVSGTAGWAGGTGWKIHINCTAYQVGISSIYEVIYGEPPFSSIDISHNYDQVYIRLGNLATVWPYGGSNIVVEDVIINSENYPIYNGWNFVLDTVANTDAMNQTITPHPRDLLAANANIANDLRVNTASGGGGIQIKDGGINFEYGMNGPVDCFINLMGYQGGALYGRFLHIGNGQNGTMMHFMANTNNVTIGSSLTSDNGNKLQVYGSIWTNSSLIANDINGQTFQSLGNGTGLGIGSGAGQGLLASENYCNLALCTGAMQNALSNTSSFNVAIGYLAGRYVSGDNNIYIGTNAGSVNEGVTINSSICIGGGARAPYSSSIAIGGSAIATKMSQIMLGGPGIVETILRGKILIGSVTPTVGNEDLQVTGNVHVNGTMQVGGLIKGTRAITNADGTLATTDYTLRVTTGATNRTINLLAGVVGQVIVVKKIDSGVGQITFISTTTCTIDGTTTLAISSQYESVTLQCVTSGANCVWDII